MKIRNLICIAFLFCLGQKLSAQVVPEVIIDTIFSKKINIRAIEFSDYLVWYVGNHNQLGYLNFITGKTDEKKIVADTLQLEFRSLAKARGSLLMANIGTPAFIFKADWVDFDDFSIKKGYAGTKENVC